METTQESLEKEKTPIGEKVLICCCKLREPVVSIYGPFQDEEHLNSEMRNLVDHLMRAHRVMVTGYVGDWHLYKSNEFVGSIHVSATNNYERETILSQKG